jgi:hypothetical protein
MSVPQPTLAGFTAFVRNVMGISATVLPDGSPVIAFALAVAMGIVNPQLAAACIPSADAAGVPLNSSGFTVYVLAVYNLAGSNLLSYAQDLPNAPVYKNKLAFFAYFRWKWNLNSFVPGVIDSSSDETTSEHMVVQDAAKAFTLANLQQLKDPFGRQYLAFAQSYGPSTWGIS